MNNTEITRKFEFDAGHRIVGHESKCAHLHGHRYVAELTICVNALDAIGRVLDFSVVKSYVGKWIDDNWDHNMILNKIDPVCDLPLGCFNALFSKKKPYIMESNPTAENMVVELARAVGPGLLEKYGVALMHVRLYETPNCWADYETWSEPWRKSRVAKPTLHVLDSEEEEHY